MQSVHERLMIEIDAERRRLSRRRLLGGAAMFAGASALAFSVGNVRAVPGFAQDAAPFADDIEVLNYALTLEHLEFAFYRDGIGLFDFGTDGFGLDVNANMAAIRDHEGAHVDTLTSVITDLGGTPVAEAQYNFADAYASLDAFLATSAAVENLGVQAYDGAAQFIQNVDLLTAAGSIVAVEARHASYLNLITGAVPFPSAVEEPLPPADVLEIAGPFIAN
ncbi:MAG: ferritin-like domain-containing protein [Chloroflexota bacterium]|nr:ferritin-like domain-containing protein [Chloroflexota bacterium]